MKEEWKVVGGYEGFYEVSNHGRVRRVADDPPHRKGLILPGSTANNGYRKVGLSVGGKSKTIKTHCLVAEAFIGPRPDGAEVNHKDGDKCNNHITNLEYVTKSQNMQHAARIGRVGGIKLTPDDVFEIRQMASAGKSYASIGRAKNISTAHARGVAIGDKWGHLSNP